jgi:hypothetical protein
MEARDSATSGHLASYLDCPRRGVSIRRKARRLAIEQGPWCMVFARIQIKLLSSALPAAELCRDGLAQRADQRRIATIRGTGSTGGASLHSTWASR